jgi:hypothetical protein
LQSDPHGDPIARATGGDGGGEGGGLSLEGDFGSTAGSKPRSVFFWFDHGFGI